MTGKRAEYSMEIRAYIKARSPGRKPVDNHCEVSDIYGEGEMSHSLQVGSLVYGRPTGS